MDVLAQHLFDSGANALLVTVVLIIVYAFARNHIYLAREMQREREARQEEKKNTERVMALATHQQELFDQLEETHEKTVAMLQELLAQKE